MRKLLNLFVPMVVAAIAICTMAVTAGAASSGVHDGAAFFSKETIAKADDLIHDIRALDNRDVLVITFAAIPDDRQDQFKAKSKQQFFDDWIEEIGRQNAVDGIVILMTREPAHMQIAVGNKTRQRSFTIEDRDQLTQKMVPLLKEKQYDDALLDGLRFIKDKMKRVGNPAAAQNGNTAPPPWSASPGTPTLPGTPHVGFPIGGMLCVGVVILLVVLFIMNIARRNRGYGGGYGAPPPGGYPPGYSGGYGGGYGGGGGGGGGFGSSMLGGLLGGALGSWGYDRFNQPNNPNYNPPTPSTGGNFGASSDQADTSYSSSGSDFGSASPPDSSSSGADFGSSSDSSSGGSDFGGGGGGDFGGGGDSGGGSSGGDF